MKYPVFLIAAVACLYSAMVMVFIKLDEQKPKPIKPDWTTVVGEEYSYHYVTAPMDLKNSICAAIINSESNQILVQCHAGREDEASK